MPQNGGFFLTEQARWQFISIRLSSRTCIDFCRKKVSSMNAFSSAVQAISKLSFIRPIDQSFVIADVKNQKISLITPKDIRDLVMTKLSWSPGIRRICVAYSPCMRCSTRNVRVAIKSGIRSIRVATSCFYLWYYSATRP